METTDFIVSQIIEVSRQLNWYYILSFNLFSGILTKEGIVFAGYNPINKYMPDRNGDLLKSNKIIDFFISIPKGIRILLFAILYTYIYLYMFEVKEAEQLFISFLFSVFFHGIIYKSLKRIILEGNEQ